ncbi:hypothetical protein BT93_K0701 [Corymbia citriodora subsp. variegata]|nr:hypothetical protein BT93_K0701 [Corymbia citriodora subsp. variegata]
MDNNNWRPTQPGGMGGGGGTEAALDGGDWRAQLPAESRERIVNKIMETLKRHLPVSGPEGLQELKKIAVRIEEKIYTAATSQSDYLRKISLKMLTMETKSQNTIPNALSSNSAGNSTKDAVVQSQIQSQSQSIPNSLAVNQPQARQQLLVPNIQNSVPSGVQASASLSSTLPSVSGLNQSSLPNTIGQNDIMQNMPSVSQNLLGKSMGQGLSSNMFVNSQRQMQARQQMVSQQQQQQSQNPQQYLYPQYHQQIMKQKLQQGNILHSLVSSQYQQQQQQQQQQNMLQSTQLQASQQSVLQTSSVMQPPSMQPPPLNGLQQSSLPQPTQSMLQQHLALSQQQPPQAVHQQQASLSQQPMLTSQQQQQHQLSIQQMMQQNQLASQQNNMGDLQQRQQQSMPQQNNLINVLQHQHLKQQQEQQMLQTHKLKQQYQQHQMLQQLQQQLLQQQHQQHMKSYSSTFVVSIDISAQTAYSAGSDWQEEAYQKMKSMREQYLPELNEMYHKISMKLQQVCKESLLLRTKAPLERVIAVLQVNKADIVPTFKEKLVHYEKQIINFIHTSRPRKPIQQGQLPPHMHALQQQQQQSQPQITQVQSHENQMNPQLQSMNLQGSVASMQQNNMGNLHHNSMSSLPGVSNAEQIMIYSLQPNSDMGTGQGNALSAMQQVGMGSMQQNAVSAPQQHLKQQQEQQVLKTQQLKQHYQQHQMQIKQHSLQQQQQQYQQQLQQAKQQLPSQLLTHQRRFNFQLEKAAWALLLLVVVIYCIKVYLLP